MDTRVDANPVNPRPSSPSTSPFAYDAGFKDGYISIPVTPPSERRIPRPPNAFILFRSDLLKKDTVKTKCPPHQQILSRLAGEMWNLLPPAEKQMWKDKAKEQGDIHRNQYPDYHFKPARRAKKLKSRVPLEDTEKLVRRLREEHFGEQFRGPSVRPSRKAKEAAEKALAQQHAESPILAPAPLQLPPIPIGMQSFDWQTAQTSSTDHPTTSPTISPLDRSCYSAMPVDVPSFRGPMHFSSYDDGIPPVPSFFPLRGFPHFEPPRLESQQVEAPRRPSTSLGFIRRLDEAPSTDNLAGPERPASASGFMRDMPFVPPSLASTSLPTTPGIHGFGDDNFGHQLGLFNQAMFDDFETSKFQSPFASIDPSFTLHSWTSSQ
ncbi:HMG box domain-containing protein [Mycena chlorophos]|uniref:HMG box domain-containing protein n=1 Tax=Mycena chlorophos TaxID=658473 RepID=A0A8H6TDD3_MYCCL|nr:HMG box domain-containing protein [Mycena chlorophos]